MTKMKLGELLEKAKTLQKASQFTKQFGELNATIVEILCEHFSKVSVQLDTKRTHVWTDQFAVLQIRYGGYKLSIPVPELSKLVPELSEQVRRKIMNEQKEKFTGFRIVSVQHAHRIYGAPVNLDAGEWVPYIDAGSHGGSYWARPGATRRIHRQEHHIQSLASLGYEEVEARLELNLRQLMSREPDGYDTGRYFDEEYKIPYWNLQS